MYLEEVMGPADERPDQPGAFVRSALFNYNAVTTRYEYTSSILAPRSSWWSEVHLSKGSSATGEVNLQGGSFSAPEWGKFENVKFAYRLTIGTINDDKQTVRLFLTPQTALPLRLSF